MAITIKSLASGSLSGTPSDANLYPTSNYALKAAVVKSIRFVNTSDSNPATVLLKLKQKTFGSPDTFDSWQISSNVITIPPKSCLIIDEEITLEGSGSSIPGTKVFALLITSTGTLDYVASGFERD